MDDINDVLTRAYREILADLPLHWIDGSCFQDVEFAKLSGLFLPGTSDAYLQAPQRIMVVGRETKTWNVISAQTPFADLDEYIHRAMIKQQRFLKKNLPDRRDKGESFFNLLRAIAKNHGSDGIAWANLFCSSWKGNSPMAWKKHFPALLAVSERLLKAQIEILKPDIIIFANGTTSAKYRRQLFPHKGEHSVCSRHVDFEGYGIAIEQLWMYYIYEKIPCYRIQHPSSSSTAARSARRYLLKEVLNRGCSGYPDMGVNRP